MQTHVINTMALCSLPTGFPDSVSDSAPSVQRRGFSHVPPVLPGGRAASTPVSVTHSLGPLGGL